MTGRQLHALGESVLGLVVAIAGPAIGLLIVFGLAINAADVINQIFK